MKKMRKEMPLFIALSLLLVIPSIGVAQGYFYGPDGNNNDQDGSRRNSDRTQNKNQPNSGNGFWNQPGSRGTRTDLGQQVRPREEETRRQPENQERTANEFWNQPWSKGTRTDLAEEQRRQEEERRKEAEKQRRSEIEMRHFQRHKDEYRDIVEEAQDPSSPLSAIVGPLTRSKRLRELNKERERAVQNNDTNKNPYPKMISPQRK